MKRVMIIGQPGSGKSTLARLVGEITHLPVVHIDQIHWQPGWVERPAAQKAEMCAKVHAQDEWVFEGGHSMTWPERLDRADTLIWLDFPLWLRAWRVLKRTLKHHGQTRPDLPDQCPERFDWEFTCWIWDTRRTGRENAQRCFNIAPAHKAKHHLQSPKDVRTFLQTLENSASAFGDNASPK